MRRFCLLITAILLSACHSSSPKTPDYEKMADKITLETAKKIEAEKGLRLCGVGGGAINHIRKLNMSFDCRQEITIEQGRELIVYCVTEYLSAINKNEEIRPYLIHFPFTPKDVEIEIFTYKNDGTEIPVGALSIVCEVDNNVKYKIRQIGVSSIKTTLIETYDEAVRLLEARKS